MQVQKVNRTEPERIYIVAKNVDADSITTGMGARFVGAAVGEVASADGTTVVKITSDAQFPMFAGIADQDIASNAVGRIQSWGYVNSVLLSAEADKTIGVTGGIASTFLKVGAVAGSFTSTETAQALSTHAYKYVNVTNTTNISGGLNYGKAFVRAV